LLSGHPAGRGDQKIPVSDILAVNVTADGFPASVFLPAPLPQGIVAQRVPEGMEIQDRNVFIISRTVIGGSVRKTDRRCYVQPTGVKTIEKKPLPPGFFYPATSCSKKQNSSRSPANFLLAGDPCQM
jgi:hypothetical protein